MTEQVSLNYNSSNENQSVSVTLNDSLANANTTILVDDVAWLQEAIDATIAAAKAKVATLSN